MWCMLDDHLQGLELSRAGGWTIRDAQSWSTVSTQSSCYCDGTCNTRARRRSGCHKANRAAMKEPQSCPMTTWIENEGMSF
jgi:hypothetical protein